MGTSESPKVTDPPCKWLLQFTAEDPDASDGDGRPWGDGTAMAARAYAGEVPWDIDSAVTPMIGGDLTMIAMREALEEAIADAGRQAKEGVPAGERGHVYIADWQFNGLRDLSSANPWGFEPWNPKTQVTRDQTALGFAVRLMSAGVNVRMLLWMPDSVQWWSLKSLADEHWSIAAAVQEHNETLEAEALKEKKPLKEPLGVVALDLRTASPESAALHQKMLLVRVGMVNTAFCGGVDLAFTRRDFGLAGTAQIGKGDWQSGTKVPRAKDGWPKQKPPPRGGYPKFPYDEPERFPEDLPANVYGAAYLHWHDHHLQLRGPIVTTLESQFAERWTIDTGGRVFPFEKDGSIGGKDQVQLTSARCIGEESGEKIVLPLPPPKPVEPPFPGDVTVQMWRTIPLREGGKRPPFLRGEFTVMAGVAKAIQKATQLITICDQYFWSVPLARLLAARLHQTPSLRLLIVLPPYGTKSEAKRELGLRYRALKALWDGLEAGERTRVAVYGLWADSQDRGVYVHAKSQAYDDQLLVVGSANMNRRSFECDAELDCAVLDQATVQRHLAGLFACFAGAEWKDFGAGWLERFWKRIVASRPPALHPDPFYAGKVPKDPMLPNGVTIPYEEPSILWEAWEWIFEPTSIATDVETSACEIPSCRDDPKKPGRLDEVTYLLERCHEGDTWPWRKAATGPFAAGQEAQPEALPRLIL